MPERLNVRPNLGRSNLERARSQPAASGKAIPEDRILDAAADAVLEVGLDRLTMADLAVRAGVARGTLYRRWENVRAVVAALLTREWARVVAESVPQDLPTARERLVTGAVRTIATIRAHPIHRAIVESDPELLVPYVFQRLGRTPAHMLSTLEDGLRTGHEDGSVRVLDPVLQARTVLLLAWSFVVTAPVVVGSTTGAGPELDALDAQLATALDQYLSPDPEDGRT
ncbi:TetR/AcrR family transcriptional regulator [Mumia sp. ZJ1417]|uniref:TetR/AcrR family transcriptional regulator n=1 Tax=Mumia sp. ZJ1417 TaxID=2708082 RepID=UPI0014213684|nr:TetR/AcrR family transcriptional regulator [Mumia sp. ZJ1417]QMW65882.1 TetR/AcrR family transcriptional regulator [Mumia sp. ZJ1417]